MNDAELEKILKSARMPDFGSEHEEDFARTVLMNLQSRSGERQPVRRVWFARLSWAAGLAFCLVLVLIFTKQGVKPSQNAQAHGFLENAEVVREAMAMFPNQVRAIVQDDSGLRLELSDRADIPDSPPLYVHICEGNNCSSFVTFSGQEIKVGSEKVTVLSQANGGIILEGEQFVWSSMTKVGRDGRLNIEARRLGVRSS